MSSAVATFPAVSAAVEACAVTLDERQRAVSIAAKGPADRQMRQACRLSEHQHAEANRAALAAYAAELLPAIFGGRWMRAERGSLVPYGRVEHRTFFSWPAVDHVTCFRRRGERGPLTWRNGVMLSEPYSVIGPGGRVTDDGRAWARSLRAEMGIAVWCSRSFSRWYPTRTALLLLAPDLRPARAAEFGFEALS